MSVSPAPIALSVLAGVLALITSLAGILSPNTYARELRPWSIQAIGQDWANLLVALALFWAAVCVHKGSWRALLIWLGCLLYFVYAFAIYAFAVHFNPWFLAYVAVLGLSFYAFAGTLASVDVERAATPLRDHPHRTGASTLLIAIAVIFGLLWLSEIVPNLVRNTMPAGLAETGLWTNPVHVLDLGFLLPAMFVVGVLLRRQHPLGLLLAVPLLVFAVTMGIGILVLFALSAMNDLPVSVLGAGIVGAIVILSGWYAWILLWPREGSHS